MDKTKQSFRYSKMTNFRAYAAAFGSFLIVIFGVPAFLFQFGARGIEPAWVIWFFWGGVALGVVCLLGGIFAADNPKSKY